MNLLRYACYCVLLLYLESKGVMRTLYQTTSPSYTAILPSMDINTRKLWGVHGDINYDEFPNGSDIMGVQMALKSFKKDI